MNKLPVRVRFVWVFSMDFDIHVSEFPNGVFIDRVGGFMVLLACRLWVDLFVFIQ